MGDLISRRAAINALCAVCGKACDKSEFVYNAPQDEQVILCPEHYCLCTLPPAQPGWIPCTPETMPEREGRYVCTYTYDGKKDVFMFRFEDGDFLVPWYVDAITAWYKPLDPWEGGQNNGKN